MCDRVHVLNELGERILLEKEIEDLLSALNVEEGWNAARNTNLRDVGNHNDFELVAEGLEVRTLPFLVQ